ncbi:hypothetical protein GOODEAATRI_029389 [Goodea atripinnis]|uniref:Uncharacterized protein n=1 Tax=Goodea atripinnis TaxID=208336 RepID=A0ABV0PI25_9TELE
MFPEHLQDNLHIFQTISCHKHRTETVNVFALQTNAHQQSFVNPSVCSPCSRTFDPLKDHHIFFLFDCGFRTNTIKSRDIQTKVQVVPRWWRRKRFRLKA